MSRCVDSAQQELRPLVSRCVDSAQELLSTALEGHRTSVFCFTKILDWSWYGEGDDNLVPRRTKGELNEGNRPAVAIHRALVGR